ncbi:MAG TPA: pilin, partial [Candidatus Pacearchaeota archaeon]|nr:pilin [Candidatus Pacearchaeota archaeon]
MKKILSLIFLLLVICTPVLADIQIGEFIITDETTSEEVISYIFKILIGIGALIAVAMVIMAGIEWMTSDGNPGKIGGAKTKIKNALLGVGILLGSYLILYTINPQIVDVEIKNLTCNYGIIVNVAEPPKKEVLRCIDSNMGKIGYDIYETINEDKWNFPSNSILKVFAYAGENYTGERTIFEMDDEGNISGDISGA